MKKSTTIGVAAAVLSASFALSTLVANAATSLSVSCAGSPSLSSIAWSATSTGGVGSVAFLWGNGSTSSAQTITITAASGTYSMMLQGTDASSTVATTTCSATVVPSATSTTATSTTTTSTTTATTTTSTGTDIGSQIQALFDQIAVLKAKIAQLVFSAATANTTATSSFLVAGGSSSTGQFCDSDDEDLQEGDHGDKVMRLQRILAQDSNIFPEGFVTGFFGERTRDAVMRFQMKFGIFPAGTTTPSGFVGPMTRSFFHRECDQGGNQGDRHSDHDNNQNDQGDDNNDN